jgi:hypothetical protein
MHDLHPSTSISGFCGQHVVIQSQIDNRSHTVAYEWDSNTRTKLPCPTEGCTVDGVNDAGDVVGAAWNSTHDRASVVVWRRHIPHEVRDVSIATGYVWGLISRGVINNKGNVVFSDTVRLFNLDSVGHVTLSPSLGPQMRLVPLAMNTNGDVAGHAGSGFMDQNYAFVYRHNAIALLTPVGERSVATSINDHGVIGGYIYEEPNRPHNWLPAWLLDKFRKPVVRQRWTDPATPRPCTWTPIGR